MGPKNRTAHLTRSLTHQLSMLGAHRVSILQQRLELVILGECDNLQDCTKLREDLQESCVSPSCGQMEATPWSRVMYPPTWCSTSRVTG